MWILVRDFQSVFFPLGPFSDFLALIAELMPRVLLPEHVSQLCLVFTMRNADSEMRVDDVCHGCK